MPSGRPRDVPEAIFDSQPDAGVRSKNLPGELAALSCYFNPCGYGALKGNYLKFAEGLRHQGIPLYTIELAFGDGPFFLSPGDRVIQVRGSDVLWQKERMLNRLLETVPSTFDKIAWVDADLTFTNPNWVADASLLLESYPVVQLFEQAVQLSKSGMPGEVRNGVAYAVARGLKDAQHLGISHPGFAWAARRELLAKHGLFDSNISGCGDSLMVYAMFGWLDSDYLTRYSRPLREVYLDWGRSFWSDVRGRVGYVPGQVLHMWHGSRSDRMYNERVDWLRDHEFDPRTDLALGENGLWRWASEKPALHDRLRRYFFDRREDD